MQQRNLGKSGLRVSVVGLGCNNFGGNRIDLEASRKVIHKALDLGITLIDTADTYGNRGESETILGECLGERRKDIVLATKCGLPMDEAGTLKGASRRYILSAIEASLKRLKTDWIDLYIIHRPDPLTPIEETLRTLDDLVRAGKVRYAGCSTFAAWQVVEAQWTATHHDLNHFVACQDEYNLLKRGIENTLMPAIQAYGLGLIPHTPLAAGLLSGKYRRNAPMPAGARMTREKRQADRWINDAN
ncbi:MAG: aldo/keto reductase, partial [Betaproteobacteria bacterium]